MRGSISGVHARGLLEGEVCSSSKLSSTKTSSCRLLRKDGAKALLRFGSVRGRLGGNCIRFGDFVIWSMARDCLFEWNYTSKTLERPGS